MLFILAQNIMLPETAVYDFLWGDSFELIGPQVITAFPWSTITSEVLLLCNSFKSKIN